MDTTTAETQAQHTMTLARIAQDRHDLDGQQFAAVLDARLAGMTWAQIGRALGVSAQAVQKRYAPSSKQP